jgi:hypothetical protein
MIAYSLDTVDNGYEFTGSSYLSLSWSVVVDYPFSYPIIVSTSSASDALVASKKRKKSKLVDSD